jgi:hypothetical protein
VTKHVPYTEAEAQAHGAALAARLPLGTNVMLMHGGPRNGLDEKAGQDTVNAFKAGLAEAGTIGEVAFEPFQQGLPYNVIKAAYIAARSPLCRAFISNAEGYGTMDGAALHVNRSTTLLGMFPFDALKTSQQRMDNISVYNQRGIAVLEPFGQPGVTIAPPDDVAPLITRDPTEMLCAHIGETSANDHRDARPGVRLV